MNVQDQYDHYAKKVIEMQNYLPEMQALLDKLPEPLHVKLDFGSMSLDLTYSGDATLLKQIFKVLRRSHFQGQKAEEKSSSYSSFWEGGYEWRVWLSFTSTQCRLVQVGTKIVEQPIYEVVCK